MLMMALIVSGLVVGGFWALGYITLWKSFFEAQHRTPAGLGLGLIVMIAILLGNGESGFLLASIAVATIVYWLDDLFSTNPLFRVVASLLVFGFFFSSSSEFALIEGGSLIFFVLIASIGAFALVNAINFSDGVNGNVAITLLAMFVYLLLYSPANTQIHHINSIALGFSISFLIVNLIFRAGYFGDIGCFLTIVLFFIIFDKLNLSLVEKVNLLGFFSYALFDSAAVIFLRIMRKENLLKRHRNYTYQRLYDLHGGLVCLVPNLIFCGSYIALTRLLQLTITEVFMVCSVLVVSIWGLCEAYLRDKDRRSRGSI